MRCLGIDFGIKRIGLATLETDSGMIFPLGTVVRTTREKLFVEILAVLAEQKIEQIVVGLPTYVDGTETLVTRQARNFAASLARRTDLPIDMENEMLTSCIAEVKLRQAGVKGKKLKSKLDSVAAMEILTSWYERTKNR